MSIAVCGRTGQKVCGHVVAKRTPRDLSRQSSQLPETTNCGVHCADGMIMNAIYLAR